MLLIKFASVFFLRLEALVFFSFLDCLVGRTDGRFFNYA